MILVDTSVWADHIDHMSDTLFSALQTDQIVMHPYVIGELSLGNLKRRAEVIRDLQRLPRAVVAFEGEVLDFIDRHDLGGTGIGYVDAHLLISARLGDNVLLWTRDRRLAAQASRLGIAYDPKA